jgi:hypothetical protein
MSNGAAQHEIALEVFEAVTEGGVRRVSWHVAQGEDWLAVGNYPGARVELAQGTPGVVWRRNVQVSLPTGARLMRVESTPERSVQRDPLAYLMRPERSAKQRVLRSYFHVGTAGRLVRTPRQP